MLTLWKFESPVNSQNVSLPLSGAAPPLRSSPWSHLIHWLSGQTGPQCRKSTSRKPLILLVIKASLVGQSDASVANDCCLSHYHHHSEKNQSIPILWRSIWEMRMRMRMMHTNTDGKTSTRECWIESLNSPGGLNQEESVPTERKQPNT